jgi:nucleoside-diphosphate-sugar epimerase
MKIVVIGGTGLIGSKTVAILRQGGHEVVAASPQSGLPSTERPFVSSHPASISRPFRARPEA